MKGRELATIVFSDAVGYSRLAGEDEETALRLLDEDFDLMRRVTREHGGEVVKNTGDGLLIIFSSAVAGTTATVQMVRELSLRPGNSRRLAHRFGIHLGDIIRTDGDVAGDGVNIAARLQTEAPVGGIALSRTVYDVVAGKTPIPAICIGERQLKNITKPVEMWHVMPDALGTWQPSPERAGGSRRRGTIQTMYIVWGVVVVVALLCATYFLTRPQPVAETKKPPPVAQPQSRALLLKSANRGAMLEGPHAGQPSLDVYVSKDSTVAEGVQPYRIQVKATLPDSKEHTYELSAMIAITRERDELIQVPLEVIRPEGLPEGTRGVITLTVDGETGEVTFRL